MGTRTRRPLAPQRQDSGRAGVAEHRANAPPLDEVLWTRNEGRRNALRVILTRLAGREGAEVPQSIDDTVNLLHALISFERFDVLAGRTCTPEEVAPLVLRAARPILGRHN